MLRTLQCAREQPLADATWRRGSRPRAGVSTPAPARHAPAPASTSPPSTPSSRRVVRREPHPARAAARARHVDDAARRARPLPASPQPGERRRPPHGVRRPARLDQRERHRRRLRRRLLERRAPTRRRGCCRSAASARTPSAACSAASPPSAITSAWARPTAPSWRRSATSRRACTPSASRRARPLRRPLQADRPGLRPRRPRDGRGRPHARRPAAAAAAAAGLPPGHGDLAHAVGAAGDMAARGHRLRQAACRHLLFVTRPTETVLDRRPSDWRRPRRPSTASTCCAGRRARRT